MNLLIVLINIFVFYSYSKKYFHFLRKHTIYSDLNNLFSQNIKNAVILNGIKTSYKKTLCISYCGVHNISFKEYTFKRFMQKVPHLKYENSVIYIKDFLIGNGRVLNEYEEYMLNNLKKTTNLIIFESDNIETITFKNNKVISNFPILEFPLLTKLDIIHYIYDLIFFHEYNADLFLLNWNKYDIEDLNFEKINILLYELDEMLNKNIEFKLVHNRVNNMIESFKY